MNLYEEKYREQNTNFKLWFIVLKKHNVSATFVIRFLSKILFFSPFIIRLKCTNETEKVFFLKQMEFAKYLSTICKRYGAYTRNKFVFKFLSSIYSLYHLSISISVSITICLLRILLFGSPLSHCISWFYIYFLYIYILFKIYTPTVQQQNNLFFFSS